MLQLPSVPLEDAAWLFLAVMAAILVAPIIARALRLPELVTFVLVGMVAGPGVLGILEREGPLAIIGEAGLLYLMFVAGLELDLQEFAKRRLQALGFGLAGFALPMLVGTVVIAAMGFEPLATVLLASCWASHTLLTYPTFRAHGRATNRAVSTSVGATIITDLAALLVLVVVIRVHAGELDPSMWLALVVDLAVLGVLAAWVLPRIGRAFFAVFGAGRNPRFIFAMLALFGTAAVGELAGIEPIIGAFLAGLGLNRLVPAGSPLMHRIEFLGDALLIPVFLLTVGLLIEPTTLAEPRVLGMAAGFIAIALGAKFAAAYGAGRVLRFTPDEIGAMAALTSAQAAATLAAAIIGVEAGIIDPAVLNAVVVVILVTCLVSSWLADRFAPRLPRDPRRRRIGDTVVVALADPANGEGLVGLASLLAAADGGLVVPVTVAPPEAGPAEIDQARAIARRADELVLATGGESAAVMRLDASPSAGIVNAMVEHEGTMLVLGWEARVARRKALFGSTIDSVLAKTPAPIVVGRVHGQSWARIVLVVAESNLRGEGELALRLAVEVVRRIHDAARNGDAPELLVVSTTEDADFSAMIATQLEAEVRVDRRRRTAIAADLARQGDLFVLPFRPERQGLRGAPRQISAVLGDTSLLAVLDHSRTLPNTEARDQPVDERFEDAVEVVVVHEEGTPSVTAIAGGAIDEPPPGDPLTDAVRSVPGRGPTTPGQPQPDEGAAEAEHPRHEGR